MTPIRTSPFPSAISASVPSARAPLSGPVELLVDLARELSGHAGHGLDLLAAGGEEALRGAEVGEEGPLADRPHPAQLVEDRARHRLVAPAAVVLDREAVGLVAHPLEQLRRLR